MRNQSLGDGKHPARKRAKGSGTLVLRGGTWQARWQVNGRVYVRSTGTGKKREAERRLADFTADFRSRDEKHIVECLAARARGMDAEIERLADERAALPMAAAFEAYRRLQTRPDTGPRTMAMYESQWWRLIGWLKANRPEVLTIQQVTRPVAEAFAEYMARSFTAGTFNKYRALFRGVWAALAETARLKANPWDAIRRKRQTPHVRRALTADELRRVLLAAEGEMRVLFAVGAYTGLRLGDCATLRWDAVDMEARTLTVIPRKTARRGLAPQVTIPLHPSLFALLDATPQGARRGPVMPGMAALYDHDTSTLAARTRRVFESCGIKTRSGDGDGRAKVDVGFHSLRHTFVSMSANAGAPLAVVQNLVGHSTPTMTMHYYHGTTDAARAAVNALPALLGADGEGEGRLAADAARAVPGAFVAALDGMTREQLLAARAEIDGRLEAMAENDGCGLTRHYQK